MKSSVIFRVLVLLVISALVGCNCATRSVGGQTMARPEMALRDVHFGVDSAKLTPTAKETLREDFESLGLGNPHSSASLVLEGHADERGAPAYNKKLSAERVSAVRSYLVSLGARNAQFTSRDLGEQAPLAVGSDPGAWAKNRTVRILVR